MGKVTLATPGRLSDGIYHPHVLRRKLCRRSRTRRAFCAKGISFSACLGRIHDASNASPHTSGTLVRAPGLLREVDVLSGESHARLFACFVSVHDSCECESRALPDACLVWSGDRTQVEGRKRARNLSATCESVQIDALQIRLCYSCGKTWYGDSRHALPRVTRLRGTRHLNDLIWTSKTVSP